MKHLDVSCNKIAIAIAVVSAAFARIVPQYQSLQCNCNHNLELWDIPYGITLAFILASISLLSVFTLYTLLVI